MTFGIFVAIVLGIRLVVMAVGYAKKSKADRAADTRTADKRVRDINAEAAAK